MKHKVINRIISLVIAVATLVSVMPGMSLTVLADGLLKDNAEEFIADEKPLTPSEIVEKEMAARNPITKDRSEGETGPYAVYVDGEFRAKGGFSDMWNLAMELAPYAVDETGRANEGKPELVEFVLYIDVAYDKTWFGEETMTVSKKKFTIDLNGHVLRRTDKGSVIKVTKNAVLTIMDSNPTKEHFGKLDSYSIWSPSATGKVKINGGVIAGGNCGTGDGGGIYIDGESTVYLQGGTIAGNKADVGSAVYLEDKSTLDMSRGVSQICYNYCAGTSSDGGTIFLRSDCTVIGGYVHHNLADDYGGGIRAKGGNITIKNVVIYANKAKDYGGGLYIERDLIWQTVTVSDCKIIGNYACEDGGGVYIYDLNMVNMSDCWVEDNIADDEGGGICVSDWTGTDLTISGKMIVRNNYVSTSGGKVKSNLYLEGDDDLIVGSISLGSEIWLRTEISASKYNGASKTLLVTETSTSHLFFFADEDGYCVKYQNDVTKPNYRHLYLEKGTRTESGLQLLEDYTTKQLKDSYTVETGVYKDKTAPIYKGYFEFGLMTTSAFRSASPFYYSDGYFFEDPTVYNTHLAAMSINLAAAAFGRSTTDVGDNAYANHFANIKQLFSDIGCADVNFFANEDYQMKPAYYGEDGRLSTIAVAISQKEIVMGDDSYILVPVAIRGDSYESEWSSNVTIGNSNEAKGFADAADQVYKHVQNYIANYGLSEEAANGKVKFWVVGYSRAGATANLTSKRLVDSYAEVGNQVYGYTFEAPMGGMESAKTKEEYTGYGAYPTIHNTVNELDFVTYVAPTEMGFIRYGVDHKIGTDYENGITVDSKDYHERFNLMHQQLNAIDPYYHFDERWKVAELSIIYGGLFGNGVIDDEIQFWDDPNKECSNMYDFLHWFFLKFQEDGLNLPTKEVTVTNADGSTSTTTVIDIDKSREYYSTFKPLASIEGNVQTGTSYSDTNYNFGYSEMTVENAAAELVSILMSGSIGDEQMSELAGIIVNDAMGSAYLLAEDYMHSENVLYIAVMLVPVLIASGIAITEIYDLLLVDWDTHSEAKKAEIINTIMHLIFDNKTGEKSVWDVLDEKQAKAIAEGLPVVLWFALNFASKDYNTTDEDDGMWGIPTFITNATAITTNHYPEVTMAWVRSNDSYYNEEHQAYTIDASQVTNEAPTGFFASASKTITLSAQEGSSIFYSVDGGNSWELYTNPVALEETPEQLLTFSIYRGAKSEVAEISLNGWSGSLLGDGNIWFLLIGAAFIVGFCVVGIEMGRKKKKEAEEN